MYFETKIINGVLCWRNVPNAEWTEFTAEELTSEVERFKKRLAEAEEQVAKEKNFAIALINKEDWAESVAHALRGI